MALHPLPKRRSVHPWPRRTCSLGGFPSVAEVTPELLDAWVRMLRLMTSPRAALAPVYEREILYQCSGGRSAECCEPSPLRTGACAGQSCSATHPSRVCTAATDGGACQERSAERFGISSTVQSSDGAEPPPVPEASAVDSRQVAAGYFRAERHRYRSPGGLRKCDAAASRFGHLGCRRRRTSSGCEDCCGKSERPHPLLHLTGPSEQKSGTAKGRLCLRSETAAKPSSPASLAWLRRWSRS